jgi:hypothetical protein
VTTRAAYLDGGKTYRLTVPQPVPGKLFWSVTAYDAETRSQVQTDQGKAALRSLFELKDKAGENSVALYFRPNAPAGKEGQWIKTNPGRVGSATSASTARSRPRSTAPGSRATLKRW